MKTVPDTDSDREPMPNAPDNKMTTPPISAEEFSPQASAPNVIMLTVTLPPPPGIDLKNPWTLLRNAGEPLDKLALRADAEYSIAYAAISMKRYYE